MPLDIYSTYYMLAAVRELPLEGTFFKSRYFPTNPMTDVFGTSEVFIDYMKGNRKMAPFVVPRIGGVAVMRDGYSTFTIEPPNISLTMPLTLDHLKNRRFGEALFSQATPEARARFYLLEDLAELGRRITRREEWMCAETMMNNGCVMKHITDKEDVYFEVEAKFYQGTDNPAIYTPANAWTSGDDGWWVDVELMCDMLTMRGLPATDLLVSADVGRFILEDPRVQKMLDNRRMEMGNINPRLLPDGVTYIGTFNFNGHILDVLSAKATYENDDGQDVPFMPSGTVVVTAPNSGRTLYGAVTQIEPGVDDFITHAAPRVPLHILTVKPPVKETQMTSKPLMAPVRANPWIVAKKVFD